MATEKGTSEARAPPPPSAIRQVECTSEADAVEAAEAGADIVMLDNFAPPDLKVTSARLKEAYPKVRHANEE